MISLSTGSLRFYETERVFGIARDLGFDGVELIVDARPETVHTAYLKALADRYAIPVTGVHSPFSFLDPPGWGREEGGRVRRSVRLAETLGAGIVVLHQPFYTERAAARWFSRGVRDLQEETEVLLAVENMPHVRAPLGRLGAALRLPVLYEVTVQRPLLRPLAPLCRMGFPMNDWDRLLRFDHLVFDTTHMATGGFDLLATYGKIRSKVRHIHLSNFNGREHQPLRGGTLPMERFLRLLAEEGYGGTFSIEVNPYRIGAGEEEKARRSLSEDLAFCRRCLALPQGKGESSEAAPPSRPPCPPSPP